jgi:hypothetical protein
LLSPSQNKNSLRQYFLGLKKIFAFKGIFIFAPFSIFFPPHHKFKYTLLFVCKSFMFTNYQKAKSFCENMLIFVNNDNLQQKVLKLTGNSQKLYLLSYNNDII